MTKFAKALGSGIKTAAKWGAGIAAAAGTAIAGLLKVDEATREYRENMGKLNGAWESAGHTAKTAKEAYNGLYKIIGDSDTTTEASQLLASIAQNTKDVAKWADIAAGVNNEFGDSLPINSMVEYAVETAEAGKVTGDLERMLLHVGINVDEFNMRLAACSSEQERARLITDTLSETYKNAAEAYKANNAETLAARDAQLLLDEALAKIGQQVANVKTALQSEFLPIIVEIIGAFMEFAKGTEGASNALQQSIKKMIDKIVEKLPDFMNFGIEVISSIAMGIIWNIPYLMEKLPTIIAEMVGALLNMGGELFKVGVSLMVNLWDGLKSMWKTITDWVSAGIKWLADKLAFWKSAKDEMSDYDSSGGDKPDGSHAGGLPYVPYDGYKAVLHRGETIMRAGDNDQLASQIVNGLAALMESAGGSSATRIEVPVYLDKREIARAIYDPMNEERMRRGEA